MNAVKASGDCRRRFWSSAGAAPVGGVSGATKRLPDTLNRRPAQRLTAVRRARYERERDFSVVAPALFAKKWNKKSERFPSDIEPFSVIKYKRQQIR